MREDERIGEIEIGVHRGRGGGYEVEIRVFDPDPKNQALQSPEWGEARIDLEALRALEGDRERYGKALSAAVFADSRVVVRYAKAKGLFGQNFRVRLLAGESAPELHHIRWELLEDPEGVPVGTSERVLFSRFPYCSDGRPINLRPKAQLKAFIAVAGPSDLEDFGMAAIDAGAEIERAKTLLAGVAIEALEGPATVQGIADGLRGADILYLLCHGEKKIGEEPQLYLENEARELDKRPAKELVRRIADMREAPRLVILLSCESAGSTADKNTEAQNALAPLLAEAGVPAILAMHGKISMKTVAAATPVFLRELLEDGQIDRALAVARGAVREQPDFWMPALFLRLKSGRIWYEPGFTSKVGELKTWASLCMKMRESAVIPILGPAMGEGLFGGYGRVAGQLADEHSFLGAAHERCDLAKVTQFLSIQVDRGFSETAVERKVVDNIAGAPSEADLIDLLDERVPAILADVNNPYRILAELPASLYICASPETTMHRVLRAQKTRKPELLAGAWRSTERSTAVQPKPRNSLEPAPETPWVYHVFGVFGVEDSLVLTEDDFFDYLIATAKTKLIPSKVEGSVAKSSLLLLGFRLDDWTFRVLFRMIMALDGIANLQGFSHVGVQIDPDTHTFADASRAREYLSAYFRETRVVGKAEPSIDVYWGSSTDFLKELRDRYAASQPQQTVAAKKERRSVWD